jgi:hypothetical protein
VRILIRFEWVLSSLPWPTPGDASGNQDGLVSERFRLTSVLYRAGHRGNCQGMFYQIGCSGETVGPENRLLDPASIFSISRVAQHLT